jgi:hypothetical protein
MYQVLPLSAQTSYAQLLEALQAKTITRSIEDAPGSFNSKEIKGKRYWYYQQRTLSGKIVQTYLGADSDTIQRLITRREQAQATPVISTLALSASRLGGMTVVPAHLRVIQRLADEGFFRAGGLLVGTHAFLAAGNMLGVRWASSDRTQDLDFAHAGNQMSVALHSDAQLDLGSVIDALNMGFVPAASLDGVRGGRWVNPADPGFVLDFLTPVGRTNKELVHIKAFNAEFQALRFMEFSLEDVQQAAIFSSGGACLVNVPDPARLAVHKLIICGLRAQAERTKAVKDVAQAKAIYAYLQATQPERLELMELDAMSRGPKWRKHLEAGLKLMES